MLKVLVVAQVIAEGYDYVIGVHIHLPTIQTFQTKVTATYINLGNWFVSLTASNHEIG